MNASRIPQSPLRRPPPRVGPGFVPLIGLSVLVLALLASLLGCGGPQ